MAFVLCIIDHFSRHVLAWKVFKNYGGLGTKKLLHAALAKANSLCLIGGDFPATQLASKNWEMNSKLTCASLHRFHVAAESKFA